MLRSAYKHFSCLNLAEVTSKNDSKAFKVTPVDGKSCEIASLPKKCPKKHTGKLVQLINCHLYCGSNLPLLIPDIATHGETK